MTTDLLAIFSHEKLSCLDFDDVALIDKAQRQAVAESMDEIFGRFLSAIDYQHIIVPEDAAFRKDLWAWGYSRLAKAEPDNAHLDFILETSATCMEYFYQSACHQSKMAMGTTTAAALLADSLVGKPGGLDQFNHFSQRYLRGLPQPDGLCDALAEGIKDCDEFYGSKNPRGGSFSVMGWLAGIDAFCEESSFAQKLPGQFESDVSSKRRTEWSVEKLPYYLRSLTGLPCPYIVPIFKPSHNLEVPVDSWISGVPDLSQFIWLVNDFFSFPKEVFVLENFNYFSHVTRARRQDGRISLFSSNDGLWTFRDTLYEAFDQLKSCILALDKLFLTFAKSLSDKVEAAQTQAEMNGLTKETEKTLKLDRENLENAQLVAKYWGEFKQGTIAWYINSPRYRLDSIRAIVGRQ
ncbi:hypothetical protein MMC29_007282 [Sticta canariensis]|nr:hypothetical protein [Sticta canariensis]